MIVDADWAGCVRTRRSTSGGLVFIGGACIKSWGSTQGSTALSSGESKYYAIMKGLHGSAGREELGGGPWLAVRGGGADRLCGGPCDWLAAGSGQGQTH